MLQVALHMLQVGMPRRMLAMHVQGLLVHILVVISMSALPCVTISIRGAETGIGAKKDAIT